MQTQSLEVCKEEPESFIRLKSPSKCMCKGDTYSMPECQLHSGLHRQSHLCLLCPATGGHSTSEIVVDIYM